MLDERVYLMRIEFVSGHHLPGDPGDRGNFDRDGLLWFLEALKRRSSPEDAPVTTVRERNHGKFDNLVAIRIEPGGLHIDEQSRLFRGPIIGIDFGAWRELAEDAIIAGRLHGRRHSLIVQLDLPTSRRQLVFVH